MESTQDIRARIKSINSTMQITKSMRLVSTAKVQKAKQRMEENRPFFEQTIKMAEGIIRNSKGSRHPYILGRDIAHSLVILITSDRGLCGGYNINAEKEALSLAKQLGDTQFLIIGAKGMEYCRRRRMTVAQSFRGLSENPFFEDAIEIGKIALEMYDSKKVDQVYLVYTEYHSMMSQRPKTVRVLPLSAAEDSRRFGAIMRYEPGEDSFLQHAATMYVYSLLYGAILESSVAEQSARITSMDAAVKNSEKILDSLTLLRNQIRQGSITQELSEIVSGASALK